MKRLVILLFLLSSLAAISQPYTEYKVPGWQVPRLKPVLVQHLPEKPDTTINTTDTTAQIYYNKTDSSVWGYSKAKGHFRIGSGSGSVDTSLFVLRTTQNPTATLTGGVTQEYTAPAGNDLNYSLNWSAGRQAATSSAQATATLSTIVVGGTSQTFSQPSAGATVNGTQLVAVVRNTNTTFTNLVTTSDGKTASATTTFTFLPKRYYGWVSDTTGLRSGAADATIRALSSELSASKVKSWSTGSPSGTQFYVYAYYATAGALSAFDMNGFPSIEAMNSVSRSFTNSEGYTGTWYIYWTINGQTTASTIEAE